MAEKLSTEKKLEVIGKISALADGVTLEYVAGLSEVVNDPEAEDSEKRQQQASCMPYCHPVYLVETNEYFHLLRFH